MAISTFVFWLVVLMTACSALVVVSARNILHAAFALCTAFLGVGALYVFLHADFVAAVQLIVYVGGILVLIMFAIMFSSNVAEDTSGERRGWFSSSAGVIVGLGVFVGLLLMIHRLQAPLNAQNRFAAVAYVNTVGVTPNTSGAAEFALLKEHPDIISAISTLSDADAKAAVFKQLDEKTATSFFEAWSQSKGHYGIGHKLVGEYILPFEVVGVLLLAALVGAVVIVRKELN